jgi:hypothetical protein
MWYDSLSLSSQHCKASKCAFMHGKEVSYLWIRVVHIWHALPRKIFDGIWHLIMEPALQNRQVSLQKASWNKSLYYQGQYDNDCKDSNIYCTLNLCATTMVISTWGFLYIDRIWMSDFTLMLHYAHVSYCTLVPWWLFLLVNAEVIFNACVPCLYRYCLY